MSITIKDLVDTAASTGGITKKSAEQVLVATFAQIGAGLKAGEEVTVRDFGRFYLKTRAARSARNPRTGATVQVAEKTIIKFAPRGDLK